MLAAVLLASAPAGAQTTAPPPAGPVSIEINAHPVSCFDRRDCARVRFGALEFISGLVVTSPFRSFGGLSSLRLDPKGDHFIALSDKARWFTGRLSYRDGRLAGMEDVVSAPALGADGRPLAERGWFDTESLAIDGEVAYVGIERVNQIVRFDHFGRDGLRATAVPIAVPPLVESLPDNKGLEALVVVPRSLPLGGTLIGLSERGLDASGNLLAFLIDGPSPGTFTVRRTDGFDISDAAVLPSGALLVLERKFSLISGISIRIRRLPLASIGPGRLVDGPSIFNADLADTIDNMEGLDVHEGADGEVVLTMISDDNFSPIQRTLLLQFRLVDP